jgi:hypothetical protein
VSIITLTKHMPDIAMASAPEGGAGAPEIELIAQRIKDHFDNRWGQYPPVLEAEAIFLAKVLRSIEQTTAPCKGR